MKFLPILLLSLSLIFSSSVEAGGFFKKLGGGIKKVVTAPVRGIQSIAAAVAAKKAASNEVQYSEVQPEAYEGEYSDEALAAGEGYDEGYEEEVAQEDLGCSGTDLRCLREQREKDYEYCMFKLGRGFMAAQAQAKCEEAKKQSAIAASNQVMQYNAQMKARMNLQPASLTRLDSATASMDQPERVSRRSMMGGGFGSRSMGGMGGVKAVNRLGQVARKANYIQTGRRGFGSRNAGGPRIASQGRAVNMAEQNLKTEQLRARGTAFAKASGVNFNGSRSFLNKPTLASRKVTRSLMPARSLINTRDIAEQAPIVRAPASVNRVRDVEYYSQTRNAEIPNAYAPRPIQQVPVQQIRAVSPTQNYNNTSSGGGGGGIVRPRYNLGGGTSSDAPYLRQEQNFY